MVLWRVCVCVCECAKSWTEILLDYVSLQDHHWLYFSYTGSNEFLDDFWSLPWHNCVSFILDQACNIFLAFRGNKRSLSFRGKKVSTKKKINKSINQQQQRKRGKLIMNWRDAKSKLKHLTETWHLLCNFISNRTCGILEVYEVIKSILQLEHLK